jgi:nifR3 family TIM-barrel protein
MLAPMEGVTHPELRAVVVELGGVGIVCTEFVRVSRGPLAPKHIRRMVVKHPLVPLSVQVMGNEADKMAEAARVVCEAGADAVDVNLGCPMPRIVRQGVGAAMLKDPVLLYDVLSRMRQATTAKLSAKIRAGFDDADGVIAIARTVERAGADYIVVHPRRRCDFYEGVADWRIVRALKRELGIPVVGNGDVWYATDALRMERETGCDAVMIGRPALRNPWIFRQIAALRGGTEPEHPSGADLVAHLERVARRYERALGRPLGPMKEMVRFAARAVPDGRAFLSDAVRTQSIDDLLRACERHLAARSADELDLDAFGSLRLERSGTAVSGCEAA